MRHNRIKLTIGKFILRVSRENKALRDRTIIFFFFLETDPFHLKRLIDCSIMPFSDVCT